ncbi:MAG: YibE/F family protein [Clostridia bacterium]|nr:YibE/F family protein [Clostridia bacterium]
MKKNRKKAVDICVILICAAALAFGIFFANRAEPKQNNPYYTIEYELVRVTQVLYENYTVDPETENALRGSQSLNVAVLTGRFRGDVVPVTNYLGPLHEKLAKAGTVMTATITSDSREEGYQISLINYDYTWLLVGMLAVFVAAVVIVGRKKGVMSLLGLAVTMAAVVFFLVPMWLKGYQAIPLTLIVCVFVTVFCFTLLGGVTRKTVSAMLGTALCVLVAGAFALICSRIAGVSGMTMSEAEWLLDESRTLDVSLKVRGLFVSGILISSLGAVMDVAMSIASAIDELREVDPTLPPERLFRSGMNIGRDMIGTMTNTLILAFAGTSLNLMIIMFAAGMQPYQLLNNNDTIMEIIRAIAGSVGLILAVPLTAAVASLPGKRKNT